MIDKICTLSNIFLIATTNKDYIVTKWKDKDNNKDLDRIDIHYNGKNVAFLTHHSASNGDYEWVEAMYVAPEHRGKGLAHRLMEELILDYPEQELRLMVRPFKDKNVSIDDLKKFYKKYGFESYDDENRMARNVKNFEKIAEAPEPPNNLKIKIANWAGENICAMALYVAKEKLLKDENNFKLKDLINRLSAFTPKKNVQSISTKFELSEIINPDFEGKYFKYLSGYNRESFLKLLKSKGWPERIRVSLIFKQKSLYGNISKETKNIKLFSRTDYSDIIDLRDELRELTSTINHELMHLIQFLMKDIKKCNFGMINNNVFEDHEFFNLSESIEVYPFLADLIQLFNRMKFHSRKDQLAIFHSFIKGNDPYNVFYEIIKRRPEIYNKFVREFYKKINWID